MDRGRKVKETAVCVQRRRDVQRRMEWNVQQFRLKGKAKSVGRCQGPRIKGRRHWHRRRSGAAVALMVVAAAATHSRSLALFLLSALARLPLDTSSHKFALDLFLRHSLCSPSFSFSILTWCLPSFGLSYLVPTLLCQPVATANSPSTIGDFSLKFLVSSTHHSSISVIQLPRLL